MEEEQIRQEWKYRHSVGTYHFDIGNATLPGGQKQGKAYLQIHVPSKYIEFSIDYPDRAYYSECAWLGEDGDVVSKKISNSLHGSKEKKVKEPRFILSNKDRFLSVPNKKAETLAHIILDALE
jgi:hypothetical protein